MEVQTHKSPSRDPSAGRTIEDLSPLPRGSRDPDSVRSADLHKVTTVYFL